MLVWDPVLEKYLAFGTLKTAALGQLARFPDIAPLTPQTEEEMRTRPDLAVSSAPLY
jgi:hypothetical protein